MLDKVPPEVLALIAYHSTLPTLLPPSTLIATTRSIRDSISPSSNPRLYVKIFKAAFDTAAVERRLGEVTAAQYAQELKRRVAALYRLSGMVTRRDLAGIQDDDLWAIYLMLIENGASDTYRADGRRQKH